MAGAHVAISTASEARLGALGRRSWRKWAANGLEDQVLALVIEPA
jgi:hypothetical protein